MRFEIFALALDAEDNNLSLMIGVPPTLCARLMDINAPPGPDKVRNFAVIMAELRVQRPAIIMAHAMLKKVLLRRGVS